MAPGLDRDPEDPSENGCCNCSADICRCIVGECICTFFFILVAGSIDVKWEGNESPSVVQVALTLGFAVGTLTQCFEHISGAHMNPAVTFAFLVTRQVGLCKGLCYIAVQFVGAFTGVILLKGFLPEDIQGNLGYSEYSQQVSSHQAFGMELLLTFLFVFAVLASSDTTRGLQKTQSLQIGVAFALITLWGYSFTGANLNPARTVAPAVLINIPRNKWPATLEVYIAGPLLGAMASAIIYRFVFNMHKKSLDITDSPRSSAIYDPGFEANMVQLQRISSHRPKYATDM